MTRARLDNSNVAAFLDMLAFSELGPALLAASDDGYNVLVGSTRRQPMLFDSYAAHPHVLNRRFNSTAAGRYQIIFPTWRSLASMFAGLVDFSPTCQDVAAVFLLKECGAYARIAAGDFDGAVARACTLWASLPGSLAGQHVNDHADLLNAYLAAGGTLAKADA